MKLHGVGLLRQIVEKQRDRDQHTLRELPTLGTKIGRRVSPP